MSERNPPGGPRPISIWMPRRAGGETVWVRPAPSLFGDHFADRLELTPRRGPLPRRVVLLGESVAAGYLYAPVVTPAKVLAATLAAVAGPEAFEVIDLARTDERLAGLVATAEAALQLDPDLLVVWAGNNWGLLETPEVSPYAPAPADRRRFAAAWRETAGGEGNGRDGASPYAGPVGLARSRLSARVAAAFDRLGEIAASRRLPVVLVLPEVDLADWESRQPAPWLAGDETARWVERLAEALAAEARGDLAALEAAAWAMNRLDRSATPVPFRLLARAWRAAGRESEARDAARAEIDAVRYPLLAFLDAPRAGTDARAALLAAASRHGFPTVDLPAVFAEHTGSPLPGRRLFLDYCHLSAEGTRVAVAVIASRVLATVPLDARGAGDPPAWRDLVATVPRTIEPAVEATALLGAVIHGAHRLLAVGERGEILAHRCRAALAASPGVAAAMLDVVAARLSRLPTVLTAAGRRNAASPYRLQHQHGWKWPNLDGDVLRAIVATLDEAGLREAEEARRLIADAGRELAGPGHDLAAGPRFLAEPVARFYPEAMALPSLPGRAALRAPWPETGFDLAVGTGGRLTLELVARLPPIPGVSAHRRGAVTLAVDGQPVASHVLGEGWTRATLRLPPEEPAPGLHRVTLHWPRLPPVGTEAQSGALARLEQGVEADLHPVFGEVFSLRVRSA